MKTLQELYRSHAGKVSDKWSLYLDEYDRLLTPYRYKPIRLLEIGIQNGGSLEIWDEFFPHAEKLVGCDVNPNCASLKYDSPRIAVVVADTNTATTQQEILAHSQRFDIIIDDASHRAGDIIRAFSYYFQCLDQNGLYLVEDLHCSYWKEFAGGLFHPHSSMSFFKRLADVINQEHWAVGRTRLELLDGFSRRYGTALSEDLLSTIHSIEFVNSLCIVNKQELFKNILGPRIVAGTSESVTPGCREHNGEVNWTPDQRYNEWSARDVQIEDELVRAEAADLGRILAGREQHIAELNAARARTEAALAETAAALAETEAARSRTDSALADTAAALAETEAARSRTESALAETEGERIRAEAALTDAQNKLQALIADAEHGSVIMQELHTDKAALEQAVAVLTEDNRRLLSSAETSTQQLRAIEQSTTWQATAVLRAAVTRLPRPVRRNLRRTAKAVYWALTPYRIPARIRLMRERAPSRALPQMAFHYEHKGICPCCDTCQVFRTDAEWFRDTLICPHCGSAVRERALALILSELLPNWRELAIHESSPAPRGISIRMGGEAPRYVASHYFPESPLGSMIQGFRNEDLENQTFGDESFDLVITMDVMEHVFNPAKVYSEIYRTLKQGGYYLHTFPIRKYLADAYAPLAMKEKDGSVHHLTDTPEYHANPTTDKDSLVVFDYGYDISRQISQWAPFDVRISRFWDQSHAIIGEYTEVIVCHKPKL
jgi:SAM-dependent methyltransferase